MKTTFVANFQKSRSTRTTTYRSNNYLVAPVILLKAGTYTGSGGMIHYTRNSLENSVVAWEGIPITQDHPLDDNGDPIPAEQANQNQIIGNLFNVHFEDGKLKGDVYLDLKKTDQRIVDKVRNGGPQEVSTGLYITQASPGDDSCEAVAEKIEPDHLAIVEQGACSWESGCGLPRTNQQQEMNNMTRKEEPEEGIWNPLGNPEPDYDEQGNELGIGMPWLRDKSSSEIQRFREKNEGDEQWRRTLQRGDQQPDFREEEGIMIPGPENK